MIYLYLMIFINEIYIYYILISYYNKIKYMSLFFVKFLIV